MCIYIILICIYIYTCMHSYIASDLFAWPYHASAAIAVMLQCHLPASRAGQPHDQRSDVWCKALDNSSTDLNRKHIWIIWSNQNLIRIYCTPGPILWFSMIILYSTRGIQLAYAWMLDRSCEMDRSCCQMQNWQGSSLVLLSCAALWQSESVMDFAFSSPSQCENKIVSRHRPVSTNVSRHFQPLCCSSAKARWDLQNLHPLSLPLFALFALSALCLDLEAEVPAGHCSGSRGWGLECECRSHNKDFFT